MKIFAKLSATVAATSLFLVPSMGAWAEDIAEPMPLGAPAPDWISVSDLQATDNFKALTAAEEKTTATIAKTKNFDIKIVETLTPTSALSGKMQLNLSLQGNKTSGHSYQKTVGGGALAASSSLLDCGYTKGKYYVAINKKSPLQASITRALASLKASRATRYYDSTDYQFELQPQSCFTSPNPAQLLKTVASNAVGSISVSGLIASVVLAPTNQVLPIEYTAATGSQRFGTYVLTGETSNPENNETAVSFIATFYVDKKSGALSKLAMTMDEPGMGFNVALTYEYLKTSAVTPKVATDHAIAGTLLQRAVSQQIADDVALSRAKGQATLANAGSKTKRHPKITPASLLANAKAAHWSASKTATGIKISYKFSYKAPITAKKSSSVTGHACVNVVKGKAVAKACK